VKTTELTPNIPDRPRSVDRSKAGLLAGEWAELTIELYDEMGPVKAGLFLSRIAELWRIDHRAMWIVLRLMTGNLSEITRSYSEKANSNDRKSKQSVQQEMEVVLSKVERRFPELANAIASLRCMSADWRVTDEF
jgi:hypothetical protein